MHAAAPRDAPPHAPSTCALRLQRETDKKLVAQCYQYHHVPREVWYTSNDTTGYRVCDGSGVGDGEAEGAPVGTNSKSPAASTQKRSPRSAVPRKTAGLAGPISVTANPREAAATLLPAEEASTVKR